MIAFRKLYSSPQDGVSTNSIITYKKKPYSWQNSSDGKSHTEYVKRIWIDCWLFVLYFEWLTKPVEEQS